MARKTTEEKLAKIRERKTQIKNEEKLLLQKHKAEERAARTRRLIERGAILESLIDGADELTNDQIAEILKKTVGSDYGVKIIAEVKSKSVTAPPKLNGETAATQVSNADTQGL